jgi:predicted nucleotidyltransferase
MLETMGKEVFNMDLAAVRGFLDGKAARRRALLDDRFARATADFERVVQCIVERHDPLRIIQWGSLLDRTTFSEISDIDIALEGLAGPEEYFALLGEIMDMTDFPLDIVEMEKIGAENAAYIRKGGRIVHERRPKR